MEGPAYTTHPGAHPSIQINDIRELTLERWLLALERRLLIVRRTPLQFEDSTAIGNKFTECSWGMCGREVEAWPDAQDHIWPRSFEDPRYRRVAPLAKPEGHLCPIDRRDPAGPDNWKTGCFYSCRIFQPKGARPTRDEAIALYETRIAEVKSLIAGRTLP